MRKLLKRLKYPIIIALMLATCIGLSFLFNHLRIRLPFLICAGVLMGAVLADYISTLVAFKLGGQEGNPLVKLLFSKIGARKGGLLVVALFFIVILFPYRNLLPPHQLAVSLTYFIVPINNLVVIQKHQRASVR